MKIAITHLTDKAPCSHRKIFLPVLVFSLKTKSSAITSKMYKSSFSLDPKDQIHKVRIFQNRP